jgi:hypothetical protein
MLHDFTKDKFDVIILAGQSNAEGAAFGPVEEPYAPDGRVWYLHQDGVLSLAAEETWYNDPRGNLGLPFAREYIRGGWLSEGRKLLILRCAVGATGFLNHRWGLTDDLYLRMMDMIRTALALNPENRPVALLWHQGETDAAGSASFETHYESLSRLVGSVRSAFSAPHLPFIAGDFVPDWKSDNEAACAPVVEAMRAVCADGCGAFVETDDLLSNRKELDYRPMNWGDDPIHFSRRAIYELGKRYFEAFTDIAPLPEAEN